MEITDYMCVWLLDSLHWTFYSKFIAISVPVCPMRLPTFNKFYSSLSTIATYLSLKDSDFIGIFYCFSNFGTILIIDIIIISIIIILFFRTERSESRISKTASHSATKLNSYMDPYPTMCSARFGVDPDYRSGSRAKSGFSDFPHYLRNLPSDLQKQYL